MTPDDMAAIHGRAMTVPSPWSSSDFNELLLAENVFVALASLSDRAEGCEGLAPAAFALGRVVVDEAELLTLAVDPSVQRQGFGRACLAAFEIKAIELGATHLHLEVAESNSPARALYCRSDWREVGRRKAYYSGGTDRIDAILMSKRFTLD